MIPADTVIHAITLTVEKRPAGLLPTYGARCTCGGWRVDKLTEEKRDAQVNKHRRYTGAEVVR